MPLSSDAFCPNFARLELPFSPEDVAARLRHLPGLMFFDSAQVRTGAISLIAAAPSRVVSGSLQQDTSALDGLLDTGLRGDRFPEQIAAGWVEYEGAFRFGVFDRMLIYVHDERCWYGKGGLEKELQAQANVPEIEQPIPFHCEQTPGGFQELVRRAQEYIRSGDIYQVNLSQRFTAEWAGDPWALYHALRQVSPAPYAAYLALGDRTVLSSSPECFLEMEGRKILTRPIKGTRPRGATEEVDTALERSLVESPKENAELVMITDLERNDLGQVCKFGSVRTPDLLKLEKFAQVFHLVSTVEGQLRAEVTHAQALRACFPGGSITGAPKKRAMEIIEELEPVPRGVYTGAIGWFGSNQQSRFSIAIRTMISDPGLLHFHTGAGIVADSDPEAEYEETLHKAAGIFRAAKSPGLR